MEFKLALAVLALGVFVGFFIAKLNLRAEAPWALEISEHFLDMAPLSA
jgi:hypothetical protein